MEDYSTGSSVINYLTISIVSKIISSVVASVAIDVAYIHVDIRNLILGIVFLSNRSHLITNFSPRVSSQKLISFFGNHSEFFLFCQLLVHYFVLSDLIVRFSSKSQSFHPQPTVRVTLKHGLELVKTYSSVLVVVILLELSLAYLRLILFLNNV